MVQRLLRRVRSQHHGPLPAREQQQQKPQPRQHSISTRLRWSYLLSSTLPLMLVGTLLIFLNFRTQQELVFDEQITLSTQAAREVSTYVSGIEAQLLKTGRTLQTMRFRDQRNRIAQELITVNYPNLRDLSMFTLNRSEITHLSQERIFSPDEYARQTDDPAVLQALGGTGYRSDISHTSDGQQAFVIALPLRNDQRQVVGAIRAEVSATPIAVALRMVGREESSNVAYLINEHNEITLEGSQPDWSPPAADLETLLKVEAEEAPSDRGNSRVLFYERADGKMVLGVLSPVSPGNWSVMVEKPLGVAFGNVWNNMLLLGTLVAMVGLIGLGWGLLTAQQFLRPLKALREGAMALGESNLAHRIEVRGTDEMAQLAQTFNQMAEQLQASLSEIEQQNARLRQELALARDIQMGLLPTQPPWGHDTLNVDACSIPAYEVGGDFYSYISLSERRAAISIGDISGKGIGAALLMALTSSMVESQARQIMQPAEVLTALNRLLHVRFQSNKMNAALLYAVFDLPSRTMVVANAGMIAPLLIRRGSGVGTELEAEYPTLPPLSNHHRPSSMCAFVEVGGLPIGAMPSAHYHSVTVSLEPGDILLFVSDGIVEAHNERGEMFGFERLEHLLESIANPDDVHLLVDLVLKQVQNFMGFAEQHDDMTIVAVRPTLRCDSEVRGMKTSVNNTFVSFDSSPVHQGGTFDVSV
ncbi:MAG: SpoIIE family protein phosphatase [Chloroflexaceae bacterium]|nr:SpoIIE family protein phosphatase [Chloroflexaceae bacterium]